jgi:hypothetical protein
MLPCLSMQQAQQAPQQGPAVAPLGAANMGRGQPHRGPQPSQSRKRQQEQQQQQQQGGKEGGWRRQRMQENVEPAGLQ